MPTLTPQNAAEIIDAFNTDVQDGDTIQLPAGSFDCSATPLEPTAWFHVTGPGSGSCTILCNMLMKPATGNQVMNWSGFTFDCTSSNDVSGAIETGAFYFENGRYLFDDAHFVGPCLDDSPIVNVRANSTSRVSAIFRYCEFRGSSADLCITTGGGDTPTNRSSWVTCIDCYAEDRGPGTSDQAWSAHDGVRMDLIRCTYRNSGGTPDARSLIAPGSSPVGGQTPMTAWDCDIWGRVSLHKMYGGTITIPAATTTVLSPAVQTGDEPFLFSGVTVVQSTNGQGILIDSTYVGQIESCRVTGGSRGFTKSGSGDIKIINCICDNLTTGINVLGTSSGEVFLRNNVFNAGTRAFFVTAGSTVTWNEDFNRSPGNDHITLGSNSFTAAAQLEPNFVPTPGGNCYKTGDSTVPFRYPFDINGKRREVFPKSIGPAESQRDFAENIQAVSYGVSE